MDKDEIRAAVELLIDEEHYAVVKKELMEFVRDIKIPRQFAGRLAPLNSLVELFKESETAFRNVIDLIERKRRVKPETSRVDYQRDYMSQRRARLRTAVAIRELELGHKLSPSAKTAYRAAIQAQWIKARDGFVAHSEPMNWEEKNTVIGSFWEKLDQQLELELFEAKKKRSRK